MTSNSSMPAGQNNAVGPGALFTPVRIGNLELRNRIAMAPMTRCFTNDGVILPEVVEYYRQRAAGGTGLIITEGIAVNHDAMLDTKVPRLDCEAGVEAWRKVVNAVHAAGSHIVAQLWHVGLMRSDRASGEGRRIGPSKIYPLVDGDGTNTDTFAIGEAMSFRDINDTIADCVSFARRAQDIGFDGIEIHGAHGYLFDQFFWDKTNCRNDGYNGDIAARTRFAAETVAAIRAATGPDFVIGLRFSQWKNPSEHYSVKMLTNPDELAGFLGPLVHAGVDFFDCSTRRYWEPAFEGSDKCLAEWTQELSGKPAAAVGSITVNLPLNTRNVGESASVVDNLAPLVNLVRQGRVDLVAVGRAIIANPDWANVVQTKGPDALRTYDQSELARLI